MRSQNFPHLANRFHNCVGEFLKAKMFSHQIDNALPVRLAASFMDRLIAHYGKFLCPRDDEDEDGIALASSFHSQPLKFLLSGNKRIAFQFPSLNVNTNLAGSL